MNICEIFLLREVRMERIVQWGSPYDVAGGWEVIMARQEVFLGRKRKRRWEVRPIEDALVTNYSSYYKKIIQKFPVMDNYIVKTQNFSMNAALHISSIFNIPFLWMCTSIVSFSKLYSYWGSFFWQICFFHTLFSYFPKQSS